MDNVHVVGPIKSTFETQLQRCTDGFTMSFLETLNIGDNLEFPNLTHVKVELEACGGNTFPFSFIFTKKKNFT